MSLNPLSTTTRPGHRLPYYPSYNFFLSLLLLISIVSNVKKGTQSIKNAYNKLVVFLDTVSMTIISVTQSLSNSLNGL